MDNSTLRIESAVIDDIPRIIDFVVSWLEQKGLGKYAFALETAVDEASTNIVKHAYSGKGGFLEISCRLRDKDIMITIKDHGRQFDPNSVPLPEVDTDLENRRIGGLGIYMMKKMVDEATHSFDTNDGNKLVLRKKISS